MKSKHVLILFVILILTSTGCSRIRRFLPVVREKVDVANYTPVPDPKICVALSEELSQPRNVNCFYVQVPEDRTLTKSPLIDLYVMVIKHEAVEEPLGDPIFILFDGPGLPLSTRQYDLVYHFLAISEMTQRRVVVFDMRAVGDSRPALSCYLEKPQPFVNPGNDWVAPCVARMEEKEAINISAYNTLEIAHDVADIASALGASQINIWARGFGTSVALRVAENYPNLVRSEILESVDTVFSDLGLPTGLHGALERAFEDCETDETCQTNFPDLRGQFTEAYAQLKETPLPTIAGLLDPYHFIWDIYALLSSTQSGQSSLPLYISAVHKQDITSVNAIIADIRFINKEIFGFSDMLQDMYTCSDMIQGNSFEEVFAQINTNVPAAIENPVKTWLYEELLARCAVWPNPGLDNSTGGRVESQAPILMVAGVYEPRFSLESAYFAKVTLENSAIIAVQGEGRNPLLAYDDCAVNFLSSFFINPALIPETTCLSSQMVYTLSVPPYDPAAELSIKEFHDFDVSQLTVSGARPDGWTIVKKGVYPRQAFEGDPTGLFHLYEAGVSSSSLVESYFAEEGVTPSVESTSEMTTDNGLTFQVTQYAVQTDEFIMVYDVATYDSDWGGFAIVFATSDFEYVTLHDLVFIPAVQAFSFY